MLLHADVNDAWWRLEAVLLEENAIESFDKQNLLIFTFSRFCQGCRDQKITTQNTTQLSLHFERLYPHCRVSTRVYVYLCPLLHPASIVTNPLIFYVVVVLV